MEAEDLDAIEHALDIRLPPAYRAAAHAGRLERLLNADRRSVIAINVAFREGDFGDENWPPHIFAFAHDGAGNFFCLDLSAPEPRVLCRDHETLDLAVEAADFAAWLDSAE